MELLSPRYLSTRQAVIGFAEPNEWDCCLENEARLMERIQLQGGLSVVCGCPDHGESGGTDWKTMPRGARPVNKTGSVTIAALTAAAPADVEVVTYVCPEGWDGIIQLLINVYTGTGFVEGSGQLIWRVRMNSDLAAYYANTYGVITTTQGSLTYSGLPDFGAGIFLRSNQRISYDCNGANTAALDPTALTICTLKGYIWPRRGKGNL